MSKHSARKSQVFKSLSCLLLKSSDCALTRETGVVGMRVLTGKVIFIKEQRRSCHSTGIWLSFSVRSGFALSAISLLQELITESQIQSVFTDIGKINFRDPSNYCVIPSVPGLASNSVASAAWLSSEGDALFALPSALGGIFVLKLPPHDAPGKEQE